MKDDGEAASDGVHLEAFARESSTIHQAARDLHVHYGPGTTRTYRRLDGYDDHCPYPGLNAFTVDQAGWFFGRDRLTSQLLFRLDQCLGGRGPLMVVAASGAGKSSLLMAGMLHKINEGGLTPIGSRQWPQVVFTPTAHPIHRAAEALLASLPAGIPVPEILSVPDSDYLDDLLRLVVQTPGEARAPVRAVIVVDQFEELFTLCNDEAERASFITWLWRITGRDILGGPLAVVACGLRADFYSHCAQYPDLRRSLQKEQIFVGSMSPDELRDAIRHPARVVGLDVETGLVEVLLADLQTGRGGLVTSTPGNRVSATVDYDAGRLPLLGHALRVTWQQRNGQTLTLDGYHAAGGIDSAVAGTAEEVFSGLDENAQAETRLVFLRLVKIGTDSSEDVRRPLSHDELAYSSPSASTVIKAFTDARLVTATDSAFQITHESLLRAWPRLHNWLNDDRDGHLRRQKIEEDATQWLKAERDSSELYRGARLQLAIEWTADHDHDLTNAALRFVAASRRTARRTRVIERGAITALVVLLVIASGALKETLSLQHSAVQQRNLAIYNQVIADTDDLGTTDEPLSAQLLMLAYHMRPSRALGLRLISAGQESFPVLISATDGGGPLAFSGRGEVLASAGQTTKSALRLWNVAKASRPRAFGPPLPSSQRGIAFSIATSPDGRILADGSYRGTVRLWNITRPSHPSFLHLMETGSSGLVLSVALSPRDHVLASGSSDGAIGLWNITHPSRPQHLTSPLSVNSAVNSVAFDPDGNLLASGSNDGIVRLWDTADASRPRLIERLVPANQIPGNLGASPVTAVAFSPNGQTLAIADGGTITLWSLASSDHPRMLTPLKISSGAGLTALAYSPDSDLLATGSSDGAISLWNVTDPDHPVQLGSPLTTSDITAVNSVAFGPDGHTLASDSTDRAVRLWSLPPTVLTTTDAVTSVAISPDGRTLASGSSDGMVRRWDLTSPGDPYPIESLRAAAPGHSIDAVAFSPSDHLLASGSVDGTIRLWSLARSGAARILGSPRLMTAGYAVNTIAFSPDGRYLAVGSGGVVRIWDVTHPQYPDPVSTPPAPRPKLDSGASTVKSVSWSRNGRELAAAITYSNGTGTVRIWALGRNGVQPVVIIGPPSVVTSPSPTWSVAFSPDAPILASATDSIQLWKVTRSAHPVGRPLPASAAGNSIRSLAFSHDGHTLIAGNSDGTIQIWNVTDPSKPMVLGPPLTPGDATPANSISFSPTARTFADSTNGSIILWNLDVSYAIKRICVTEKDINRREWHHYVQQLPYSRSCT
jgi:WD40 repeat protein